MIAVSPRHRTGYGFWTFLSTPPSTRLGQLPEHEMKTGTTEAAAKDPDVWGAITSAFSAGAEIYEAKTKEEIAELEKEAKEAEARAKAEIERIRAASATTGARATEPSIPTAVWIGGGILAAGVLAALLLK